MTDEQRVRIERAASELRMALEGLEGACRIMSDFVVEGEADNVRAAIEVLQGELT